MLSQGAQARQFSIVFDISTAYAAPLLTLQRKANYYSFPGVRNSSEISQCEVFADHATRTRIQVKYQLSVEWLPGKVYTWNVDEMQESVLF